MLLDSGVLDSAWLNRIVAAAQKRPNCPVHLYVAANVDSVCACHILTHMLHLDHLPFDITPVRAYDAMFASLLSSFDFTATTHTRSVPAVYILLNCGGTVDLERYCELQRHPHVQLFVLDANRPLHMHNMADDNVQVVTVHVQGDEWPQLEAEAEEEADEDEDEVAADARLRQRAREAVRRRNKAKLREYYSERYYSSPCSTLVYHLCMHLSRETPLTLWWAIVGLTDAYIHERVARAEYDRLVDELNSNLVTNNVKNEQNTYYDNPLFPPAAAAVRDREAAASELDAPSRSASNSTSVPVTTSVGHIRFNEKELRLLHVRHLPLYDSMQYTPYLSSQLRRWQDRGVGHIRTLLIEMGIPLEKATQAWMEEEMEWRLQNSVDSLVDKHPRLKDITQPSFDRKCTNTLTLSASDCVHIACALLEQDEPPPPQPASRQGKRQRVESESVSYFWSAYQSLDCDTLPLLTRGLNLSKQLIELQTDTGLELMRKKAVKSLGPIRSCTLSDGAEQSQLAHPLLLLRLAMFVYDCVAQREEKLSAASGSGAALKPVVLACLQPNRHTYLVVGVQSTAAAGHADKERSRLPHWFRKSADGLGIMDECTQNSFDGNAMEVPARHITKFMEYMHSGLADSD